MNNLKNIIEAILFVSGEPVKIKKLSSTFNVNESEVMALLDELIKNKYGNDDGIQLQIIEDEAVFTTNNIYYDYISNFFNYDKTKNLSNAALEVLSIVAYKQPVTKSEIDNIRGVKSDYILSKLVNDDFIYISDKLDAPGLPNLYSTTSRFLRKFNLNNLDDLPTIEKEEVKIWDYKNF